MMLLSARPIMKLFAFLVASSFCLPGCAKPASAAKSEEKVANTITAPPNPATSDKTKSKQSNDNQSSSEKFATVQPTKGTIQWTIEQPGVLEAFESTPIVAKVGGYIEKIYVDIDDRVDGPKFNSQGQMIKPGTLLAKLAIPELDEEVNLKEAMSQLANSEIEVTKRNLEVALATIQMATQKVEEMIAGEKRAKADFDRWESENRRLSGLAKSGITDKQTAEETQNQFLASASTLEETRKRIALARATLQESIAKRNRIQAEVTSAEVKFKSTLAEVRRVKALQQYSEIRAPYDAIVTARFKHTGHFVQSATGTNMERLFTIARVDPLRIVVQVPESEVAFVHKGVPASVRLPALSHQLLKGTIARTSWQVRADARTLRVEIDLPNPKAVIRPGVYAFAYIPVQIQEVLTIPLTAINIQDDMEFVYLVRDQKLYRYQIRTGRRDETKTMIIQKKIAQPGANWEEISGSEEVMVHFPGNFPDGTLLENVGQKP